MFSLVETRICFRLGEIPQDILSGILSSLNDIEIKRLKYDIN